jgi:membrane fusion protein (multidrug efflux system)
MKGPNDPRSEVASGGTPRPSDTAAADAKQVPPRTPTDGAAHSDQHAAPTADHASAISTPPAHHRRRLLLLGGLAVGLVVAAYSLIPMLVTALNTVSTDDAYVNGHVTLVAPRVLGQVKEVLVDDNYRVQKGDLLVQLDPEPYQVQVDIKEAALTAAKADMANAEAQTRALVAQTRANRYKLDHAIEDVHNQVATLRANVATWKSKKATLELSKANLERGKELAPSGGISKEELDQRKQTVKVDEAAVEQALQTVYANRVGLGLPAQSEPGHDLGDVPDGLDENFSSVRQALGTLLQTTAQLGYFPTTWDATPKKAKADFYKQDAQGDLDKIYAKLIDNAPAIKQAKAKLLQAQSDLDQAKLNLRYCKIVSEIDGVVTSRNVNPGNNVSVGQSLMAVRSLTEIWIDANFKETQLANLRIGQRVRCEVDMYGSRREYEGRITGFTMGTGQTLSLLPPQNATGNFVKIVQRLPVRIELQDYDPDKEPLFVGLSVEPYVYYKETPTGANAGAVLQPFAPLPKGPTVP